MMMWNSNHNALLNKLKLQRYSVMDSQAYVDTALCVTKFVFSSWLGKRKKSSYFGAKKKYSVAILPTAADGTRPTETVIDYTRRQVLVSLDVIGQC